MNPKQNRTGAVAVEFAVTAGIALMFFFAAFEFTRVAMIRHTVDNAVYEGARTGIIPGASVSDVKAKANKILDTLGLSGANINVTPTRIKDDTRDITVEITVPIDANTFGTAVFFQGKTVKRSLKMRRESVN